MAMVIAIVMLLAVTFFCTETPLAVSADRWAIQRLISDMCVYMYGYHASDWQRTSSSHDLMHSI
eukprot:12411268-Karenia_brevis.AAC.1